jgi:hypothetical protein
MRRRAVAVLRAWLAVAAVAVATPVARAADTARAPMDTAPFTFAVVGDTPYFIFERPILQTMLREAADAGSAFVVHVGDIKRSTSPCDDATYDDMLDLFSGSATPLVYVPGDNEWTDCHIERAGAFDPLERLARLREVFFREDASLGARRMPLARQSDAGARADPAFGVYRENMRWSRGGVPFVTLNVPGSRNNTGRTAAMDAEAAARGRANAAWLAQAFEQARREASSAIVVIFHANPGFERPRGDRARRGYEELIALLEREVRAFGRPVLLVHGDTHQYRFDQPAPQRPGAEALPNLWRVESFGSPVLGWVRIDVTPGAATPFAVTPMPFRSQRGD